MDDTALSILTPRDVIRALKAQPARWLAPMILATVAALAFALLRTRTWEAQQALLVRDEVSLDASRSVNTSRADELKAAQETIVELAHSQSILQKTLKEVGPSPHRTSSEAFPSGKDVEELAEEISVAPPKGAEFGKTDIFYLKVQNRDRQRALTLARVLSEQTQNGFENLRQTKAHSVIGELEKTVQLARQELNASTTKLAELERQVGGSDLGELRIMNELPSGMSDLRNEATAIEQEIRKETSERMQNEQLLAILRAAVVDAGELLACPNNLLNAQPGLRRLKDGLVDAQLRRATLLGSMSDAHPQVVAAETALQEIGQSLHNELDIAIKGIEADLKLSSDRLQTLEDRKASLQSRFNRLADIRAEYSNLAAMTKHRGEILKTAEQELAGARSKLAAAHNGALLQILGEPTTGTRPIGPGNTMLVLAGMAGGLLIGVGLVILSARPQPEEKLASWSEPTPADIPVNEAVYKIPQRREVAVAVNDDNQLQAAVELTTAHHVAELPATVVPPMIEPQPKPAAVYKTAPAPSPQVLSHSQSATSGTLSIGQALQQINQLRGNR